MKSTDSVTLLIDPPKSLDGAKTLLARLNQMQSSKSTPGKMQSLRKTRKAVLLHYYMDCKVMIWLIAQGCSSDMFNPPTMVPFILS